MKRQNPRRSKERFIEPAEKHFSRLLTPRGADPCERIDNLLPWDNAPVRQPETAPSWRPAPKPYYCPDCGGSAFWQLPGGRWICSKCRPQPEARQETAKLATPARLAQPVNLAQPAKQASPELVKAGGLLVTFDPKIALAATRRQCEITYRHRGKIKKSFVSYAPALRAWLTARAAAAAAGTCGDVAINLFYQAAKKAGIPRRTIEHGVNQARELGWLRKIKGINRPDRFVIAGQKALALDTNTRPSHNQVNLDTARLAGAGWRGVLFAAWEETQNRQARPARTVLKNKKELANLKEGESKLKTLPEQKKILRPISRKREEELTGIDRFTAARYDRQAGVKREHNWHMTNRPVSDLPMYREQGIPAIAIKNEIATRKPDAREFAGVKVTSFGRGKNIIRALVKRGASNPSLLFSDCALSARQGPGKIFCQNEKEAESLANKLAKDNQPPRDIFIPAGSTSGGARLWRQYLCL